MKNMQASKHLHFSEVVERRYGIVLDNCMGVAGNDGEMMLKYIGVWDENEMHTKSMK
jgi:hypothetical protein